MARRLDWEAAAKRDLVRKRNRPSGAKRSARKNREQRQWALAAFVEKHNLSCFVCKSTKNEWAKTGMRDKRPWAICVPCVKKR